MGATSSITGTTEEETALINNIRAVLETIAKNDAQSVDNSCVGFGTNDKDLIELLCSRTKLQLEALDKEYRKEHEGKKLEDVIDSETSGDYRKFLKMMIHPRGLFLCQQLKKAMDGMGTDEKRMNEIFCVISTEDMKAMKDTYEGLTGNRLLDTIRSELGGEHKELIAHLLMEGRDHSTVINQELAKEQAQVLIDIIKDGKGFFGGLKDEAKVKFAREISKISPYQLYAVQDEWDRAGQDESLQSTIKTKLSGDLEQATLYLLKRPEDFFAEKIKEACDGLGTDEDYLSFIVGGVDKHTALKVAARYYQKFNEDVIARMHDEVCGDYKNALLGWLKNEDPSKGQENELWQRLPGSIGFYNCAASIYENLLACPSAQGHVLPKKDVNHYKEMQEQKQQQEMQQQLQLQQQQQQQMQIQMQQQQQMYSSSGGYKARHPERTDWSSDSDSDSSGGSETGKRDRRRERRTARYAEQSESEEEDDDSGGSDTNKAERRQARRQARRKERRAAKRRRNRPAKVVVQVQLRANWSSDSGESSGGSDTGKRERRRERRQARRAERRQAAEAAVTAAADAAGSSSDSASDSSGGSETDKKERRRAKKAARRAANGGPRGGGGKKNSRRGGGKCNNARPAEDVGGGSDGGGGGAEKSSGSESSDGSKGSTDSKKERREQRKKERREARKSKKGKNRRDD